MGLAWPRIILPRSACTKHEVHIVQQITPGLSMLDRGAHRSLLMFVLGSKCWSGGKAFVYLVGL